MDVDVYVWGLIIAACLAFIPASIAKRKGYSFGLWWLYGWLLFIVALIHVSVIQDKNEIQPTSAQSNTPTASAVPNLSAADELKKYKELLDSGAITEEEYTIKKYQLLKLI